MTAGPTVALAGTGATAAMFAAAARTLGWPLVAISGESPQLVADHVDAPIVPLDELLTTVGAEIVIVDTPAEVRAGHAASLLDRGVHVLLTPGLDADGAALVASAAARSSARLVMAEMFPTAPAVQRWFVELGRLGRVEHLSGRASPLGLAWPLTAVAVFSTRLAGWGDPTGSATNGTGYTLHFASGPTARLGIAPAADLGPARWELQAASARGTLRVELLPVPTVERDGEAIGLPASTEPAETFGAAPLLRTFWADVEAGRPPVLDAAFGALVERLLSPS